MLIQYQSPIDSQTPEQRMTADTQNRSKNQFALNDRILELVNGFKELESKFNIILSQGDIVKSVVVDLENIVKEINKMLSEIKRSSGHSQKHMQPLAEKVTKLVQCSNCMAEKLKNSKIKTEHLKNSFEKTNSLSTKEKSPNNSKTPRILISEEGIKYLEVGEEDFTEDIETHFPPLREEIFPRSKKEGKKKLLLNIFLVTIFAISSIFVWYYFSPQNQHLPEGKIAQNIKTPTSQTITKKPPTPTDKSPAQRYSVLKTGVYNVNISSFKEKKTNP